MIRSEGSQPQKLPVEQVIRRVQSDAWTSRRIGRVGHDVTLERFDEGDTRILAAPAAVGAPLVLRFWLQGGAEPLDGRWIAGCIELYSRNPYARVIPLGNQPREKVELTIRTTSGGRVQDTFDLMWISRFRLDHHVQPLQLKSTRLNHRRSRF